MKQGGWQVNVEYFDDYVIKTPKTKKEIIERVKSYLKSKGKLEELDKRVKDMQEDWKFSISLIKKKKFPSELIGNIEFLKDGKIKQSRAIVLEDILKRVYKEKKINELKRIISQTLDLILELWKYGIVEKTSKIGSEMGIVNGKVILIDIGELSNRKDIAERQINNKKWYKDLNERFGEDIANIFMNLAEKKLTLKVLNDNWDIKRKG